MESFLQIHITGRCNLSCSHCYGGEAVDMREELFQAALCQFEELADHLGVERGWVQLTGGEPLLHPVFDRFLEYASRRIATKVLTNGTIINGEVAEPLARRCASVQVSFDGLERQHDTRRGYGAYSAALNGLVELKRAGAWTSARISVGSDNQDCVEPLFETLSPHIDAFHVSRVVPMGGCGVALPDAAAYRSIIYSLYARHRGDPRVRLSDPFFGVLSKVDYPARCFDGCSAGLSGLCITQTGDIYPCRRLPILLGNLRTHRLQELYDTHPLLVALRERRLGGRCGDCDDRFRCGGSRCIALALTGDPLADDPGCIFA